MRNDCGKFKGMLLEAALSGVVRGELQAHLQNCGGCSSELADLRVRRERLDALLPRVAREEEPSAGFRARVLAAAESAREGRSRRRRVWILAGATAAIVAALTIGFALQRRNSRTSPEGELVAAEKLAEWRAPSDVLLLTPGREILRTTPKLGESYLKIAANTKQISGEIK
jgi:anti-sigma factor RsiW